MASIRFDAKNSILGISVGANQREQPNAAANEEMVMNWVDGGWASIRFDANTIFFYFF